MGVGGWITPTVGNVRLRVQNQSIHSNPSRCPYPLQRHPISLTLPTPTTQLLALKGISGFESVRIVYVCGMLGCIQNRAQFFARKPQFITSTPCHFKETHLNKSYTSCVTYRRQPTVELLACFIEILFHYMPYQRVRSGIITAVRFIRTGRINKQYAQVSLQLRSVTYRNNACFNPRIKCWLDNATAVPLTVSHMSNYTRFASCEEITAVLLNSQFFWTLTPYRLITTYPRTEEL